MFTHEKLTPKQLFYLVLAVLLIVLFGLSVYQHTHFNRNVKINSVPVGGLTVNKALAKVQSHRRNIKVYVNGDLVYQKRDQDSGFSSADQGRIKDAQRRQHTFFPSHKSQNLIVQPSDLDKSPQSSIDSAVNNKIKELNQSRQPSRNAYAKYNNGKVYIVPAVQGDQYSRKGLAEQVNYRFPNGTIRLHPSYIKPITGKSQTVQNEKQHLTKMKGNTVNYQVQGHSYHLTANDIVSTATYRNGHYHFETSPTNNTVAKINHNQATLGNSFTFKTPNDNTIKTASGGNYGWKISAKKAGNSLSSALANGQQQINASHDLVGKGFNHHGTGYTTTSNHGLGNTYAVVSLNQQHAWFYEKGKCVMSEDIVSGSDTKSDRTPKGVWYIMYQQSPSVLRGTNDNGSKYSSPVQYWSPFTLSGCGFHDASWRHDWSKTAYKETGGGSHGCINMHPENAGIGSHALSKGEPVIIY